MEPLKSSPVTDHAVHFGEFIQRLAEKFEPLQIFRFSQNIFLENYQDGFSANQDNFRSNYCLLVVTEAATRVDYEMQEFASKHCQNGKITIISHGRQSVWDAINANSRFFKTVFTSGEL